MLVSRWAGLSVGVAVSALAAGPAKGFIVSLWADTPSSEVGFTQNNLEVSTSLDWVSTQLLVELSSGEFLYVTPGVVPSLDPTLLIGATGNTSQTFPSGGDPNDPLNSQIPGLGALTNVGTGGQGGLGGSIAPVIDLNSFDLTYFGPPTEQDDVALGTPLDLAQMTVSNDAFGTWATRLRNSNPNDPQNQPADTTFASGFVFRGVFYNGQIPGDTDNDGDIDDSDLGTAFANYTGPVGGAGGKGLTDGDTDGDGDVDDSDLGTVFANYSGPLAPAPVLVPEPGSIALLIVLTAPFYARRRRFSRILSSNVHIPHSP